MSDVQDWTGVSAGATQLVGTGFQGSAAFGPSFQFNWNVPNIPQTTRSLVLITKVTAATGGVQSLTAVSMQGASSGLVWFGQGNIPDDAGNTTVNVGTCAAPIYAPFYGQIDSQVNISIGASVAGSLEWWLIALPDADLLGSNPIPVAIANSSFSPFTPNNQVPILVKNGNGLLRSDGRPYPTGSKVAVGSAAGTIIAAPGVGLHILLYSAFVQTMCQGAASAGIKKWFINGTIGGSSAELCEAVGDSQGRYNNQTYVCWPGGLLLDANTASSYGNFLAGTAPTADNSEAVVMYDIVS